MNEPVNNVSNLHEQAAEWFMLVRARNADAAVHAQWSRWIEADPEHRAAFEEIQQTWDALGAIESPPWPSAEEVLESSSAADEVGSIQQVTSIPRFKMFAGLAAACVLCVMTVLVLGHINRPTRITTARAQQQSAVLPDGSRIELGAATGIELEFTAEQRLVKADEGEVFYKVKHDASRPFIVQNGPVTVTAIGTAFSVRREGEAVSVVVTEGIVDVKSSDARAGQAEVRAMAGQRISFDHGQLSTAAQSLQPSAATWRRGQLRFENDPLRVVVASLSRYSSRQIVLADSTLAELRFTGTVFDDSTEDWLKAAQRLFPLTVDYSDPQRIVILAREQ